MKKINLLIADDHPIFLKGLREVIEKNEQLRVITEVHNGLDAVTSLNLHVPDVVILDVDMPKMNGLEAAEKILESHPDLPILLLTMHKERAPFLKALEIGILGYVLKENAVIDVIHGIETVLAGNPYISPEMSAFLLKKQVRSKSMTVSDDYLNLLTPSEIRILQLIAVYKSSKEIADELFISEKTVFNHRTNISKKLNLSGKNAILRFAIENYSGK